MPNNRKSSEKGSLSSTTLLVYLRINTFHFGYQMPERFGLYHRWIRCKTLTYHIPEHVIIILIVVSRVCIIHGSFKICIQGRKKWMPRRNITALTLNTTQKISGQ